jgi:hypothetical protein
MVEAIIHAKINVFCNIAHNQDIMHKLIIAKAIDICDHRKTPVCGRSFGLARSDYFSAPETQESSFGACFASEAAFAPAPAPFLR